MQTMPCFNNAPTMNIGEDLIDLSKGSVVLQSDVIRIRGLGTLSSRLWKRRQVTLVENALLIQHSHQHASSQRLLKHIPLQSISKIERVNLTPACLLLESSCGRRYHLSFANDAILYDWQDDIYPRSRLGNFSSPFNFVHQVHHTSDDYLHNLGRLSASIRTRMQSSNSRERKSSVGTTNYRASSEISHTPTYLQPISPQRASFQPCRKSQSDSIKFNSHKRSNSASSGSTCHYAFDPSIHPTGSLSTTPPIIHLEGLYQVKRTGKFSLFSFWRERYVVLTSRTLEIRKTQASNPEYTVCLPHITDASKLKLKSKPFVLRLTTESSNNRKLKYCISLPNTCDLINWHQRIATRCIRTAIGEPEGFTFPVHVSWNPKSQTFAGLPDEWKTYLEAYDQEKQVKEKEPEISPTTFPATQSESLEAEAEEQEDLSPMKPFGPSCRHCYNNLQCTACKFDRSTSTTSQSPKAESYYYPQSRTRPFSMNSGTTLIGDHDKYRFKTDF